MGIWGRVLEKFQEETLETRTDSYPDDGYIKGNLIVVLGFL
jgi:hypothetical protein